MINAAIVQNNKVENIIYISETVMTEWCEAGKELINCEPLGLIAGDYREEDTWYRDVDGQKVSLPLPVETGPTYAELLVYYQNHEGIIPENPETPQTPQTPETPV